MPKRKKASKKPKAGTLRGGRFPGKLSGGQRIVLTSAQATAGINKAIKTGRGIEPRKKAAKKRKR